jgi:hypothetical protein
MSILDKFTPLSIKPYETNMLSGEVVNRLKNNIHNEMYQSLEDVRQEVALKQLANNHADWWKNVRPNMINPFKQPNKI